MLETKPKIKLEIVTPDRVACDHVVDSVTAPGVLGEFGVLPLHRPMLAACRSGVVRYTTEGRTEALAIGPGFAEVEPDRIIILTDQCKRPDEIDGDAARKEFEDLDARYKSFQGDTASTEFGELERDHEWIRACLDSLR